MSMPGSFPRRRSVSQTIEEPLPNLRMSKGRLYQRRRARPDGHLRIVIICENVMPKVDGVTRTLCRLLEHLHSNGHECLVLCPETALKQYNTIPLIGTAGIPLIAYPGLKLNFISPVFMSMIIDYDPDLIHIVDPIWLGAQMLWALELGWGGPQRPIVASYHTNIPTYLELFGLGFLTATAWGLLKSLHDRCLITACPSQSTADMLVSRGIGRRVRIWPRGVDPTSFHPLRRREDIRRAWGVSTLSSPEQCHECAGLPTPPPSPGMSPVDSDPQGTAILYVGRISYEKNLLFLLYAFSYLRHQLRDWTSPPRLIFIGDGPAFLQIKQTVVQLGLEDAVVFEGHINDHSKLAEYYASADLFAFPSYTETFGQVVAEALASGLPVVGLDAPGTRDLVDDERTGCILRKPSTAASDWCALLRDPSSPIFQALAEQYAALMETLVLDPSKRKLMGHLASSEGNGRSWNDAMECMVGCYREAVSMPAQMAPPRGSWRIAGTQAVLGISMGILYVVYAGYM
ncbi:UDP-Glycosyltransferase/glycogen phosphorylase [Mycena floridula]|nr:UDP-Glycosyltransferase/glycogen phosphorylase [Mycena floridula]